jgi:FkbM family methyltransferase
MLLKPIVSPPSPGMWIQLQLLGLAGAALRWIEYRGLFAIAARLKRARASDMVVRMHPDVQMVVSSNDAYWLCFMPSGRCYEPEIEALLERLRGLRVLFCDAGANQGYWALMASRRFGWPVVAIEAAAPTAAKLRRNLELNACSNVEVVERALSDRDDLEVEFYFDEIFHAGARVVGTTRGAGTATHVRTITVDTALRSAPSRELTVLKIDVEGQEQAALDGSRETLKGPCLVIYEEHGSVERCRVTERLLADGYQVMFMENGRFVRIRSADDAQSRLRRRSVGYNFAATRDRELRDLIVGHPGST